MRPSISRRVLALTLLSIAAGACSSSSEPLTLKAIDLGSAVGEDTRVTAPTRIFAPESAVYASIATAGSGRGTLTVQWFANTEVVATQTQTIDPTAPAHFAFHFVPPGGWPQGKSRIRFSLDDGPKHTAEFEIR